MLLRSRYPPIAPALLTRLAPALLVLAATLLLGMIDLPFAQRWRWFESPMTGLVFAGVAGLAACHLALLSTALRDPLTAALPAALLAGALPGPGLAALLVPLTISAYAAVRLPGLRAAARIGLAGTAIALAAAGLHSPALHLAGSLTLLAAATLQIRRPGQQAANDNSRDEPFTLFWGRPAQPVHAMLRDRTSSPISGE